MAFNWYNPADIGVQGICGAAPLAQELTDVDNHRGQDVGLDHVVAHTTGLGFALPHQTARGPVSRAPEQAGEWMDARETDPETLRKLLVPADDNLLIGTPVSDRANSVKNDDPSVLEEAPMLL